MAPMPKAFLSRLASSDGALQHADAFSHHLHDAVEAASAILPLWQDQGTHCTCEAAAKQLRSSCEA